MVWYWKWEPEIGCPQKENCCHSRFVDTLQQQLRFFQHLQRMVAPETLAIPKNELRGFCRVRFVFLSVFRICVATGISVLKIYTIIMLRKVMPQWFRPSRAPPHSYSSDAGILTTYETIFVYSTRLQTTRQQQPWHKQPSIQECLTDKLWLSGGQKHFLCFRIAH